MALLYTFLAFGLGGWLGIPSIPLQLLVVTSIIFLFSRRETRKKGWRARMSKVSARPLLGQLQAVDLEYPVSICVKIVRGFTARGAEVSSRVVKPHAVIGKLGTWTKGPGRT